MLKRYLSATELVTVPETQVFNIPELLSKLKDSENTIEIAGQDDYHHFLQIYEGETDFRRYPSDTFYLVLDGKIELEFEGHEPIELERYDCLRIRKWVTYRVKSNERSTVLRFQSQNLRAQQA